MDQTDRAEMTRFRVWIAGGRKGADGQRPGVSPVAVALEPAEEGTMSAEQAAVMADDLPDLPMMHRAGYAMAVADAVEEVRAEAAYVTTLRGGDGAVREAVEHLLKARDRWHEAVSFFG